MQQLQPDYKFYPSLLDAYKWYQASESDSSEQELINKINRVPFKSDSADKGTWFNELIDHTLKGYRKYNLQYLTGAALEVFERLKGASMQVYTSTFLEVDGKIVELYGYIDYVLQDKVIDLKTTQAYELGKYQKSMQLHFYPVSLIDEGNVINEFEFLVTDFANVYPESYKVDYDKSKLILIDSCKELMRFVELKKHFITDKKIFGLENVIVDEYNPNLQATIIN